MRVVPGDRIHLEQLLAEEAFWEAPPITSAMFEAAQTGAYKRFLNAAYTGDPSKSWMDDLIERGPFGNAAALGSTQGTYESLWLQKGGSRSLDVFDISTKVLARARAQLGRRRFGVVCPDRRARFFKADLNFVDLPREHYEVIWSTGCLHHVVNLEYLLDEVQQSLRPGGLLAVFDYIGEPRSQYGAQRLRAMNEIFERIPRVFRFADTVEAPPPEQLSPFEAIRSDECLRLIRERFDVVHLAQTGSLYPMGLLINFAKIEAEDPELLKFIFAADEEARSDESLQKCAMYGVFRKRPGAEASAVR